MCKYVGKACAGDRFVATDCGCVFLVTEDEIRRKGPGADYDCTTIHQCTGRNFAFARVFHSHKRFEMMDYATANVYMECVAIEGREGTRWQ